MHVVYMCVICIAIIAPSTTVSNETFEGENLRSFHGFSINCKNFPTNFNT